MTTKQNLKKWEVRVLEHCERYGRLIYEPQASSGTTGRAGWKAAQSLVAKGLGTVEKRSTSLTTWVGIFTPNDPS